MAPPARRSKYGNVPTAFRGRVYASKREAGVASELHLLTAAGRVLSWRRQVPFEFRHNGVRIGSYRADFVVRFADGRTEVWDAKGYADRRWPLVKRLMRAFHGVEVVEK